MAIHNKNTNINDINSRFRTNTMGEISAADARFTMINMVESARSELEQIPTDDVEVPTTDFTNNLAGVTKLSEALAILDNFTGTGGGGTGVTGVLSYGIVSSSTAAISAPANVNFTTGRTFHVQFNAAAQGQYYALELPSGFEVDSIVNSAHIQELPAWTRTGQRWTLGPLNASEQKTYMMIIREDI